MEGYNLVKVSKIAKIILGGTPKRSEEAYWGGRIKWASLSGRKMTSPLRRRCCA